MTVKLYQSFNGDYATKAVATSTTLTANTFGVFSSGYLIAATTTSTELPCLILEGIVTTSGHETVLVKHIGETDILLCDTNVNTAASQIGGKYDISAAGTVNLSFSTYKVVEMIAIYGATTDKKGLFKGVKKDA